MGEDQEGAVRDGDDVEEVDSGYRDKDLGWAGLDQCR